MIAAQFGPLVANGKEAGKGCTPTSATHLLLACFSLHNNFGSVSTFDAEDVRVANGRWFG
jgi:hypothetical protein